MTPGESAAVGYTGYLTERAITGLYAKAVGGAIIIVEVLIPGRLLIHAFDLTMEHSIVTGAIPLPMLTRRLRT
jgi:hypothetical protein